MLEDQPTLDRYWLFIEPSDYFPEGYLVYVVGEAWSTPMCSSVASSRSSA
jgi:hypothetical protein